MSHIINWWKIVNCKHPLKGKHLRDLACDPVTSKTDLNVEFLQKFVEWLYAWQKLSELPVETKITLGVPIKGGMLSKETQFALMHTTKTLLLLIEYIFDNFNTRYVLLGKFQTDNLEARFGQYRQMPGGNYCISFRQILESEKKLKVLELIKLHSCTLGEFMLKELDENELPTNDNAQFEYSGEFSEILDLSNQEEISESTMSVLIYIARYVGYKLTYNILCEICIKRMVSNKIINYESSNNVSEYLKLSSRGGLKWPQEFTLLPVVYAFKIFQSLISAEYEDIFLNHGHQKNLLMKLIKDKLCMENIPVEVCICGTSSETLLKKCLSVISNILLNNYCKVQNDKIAERKNKKRKLLTVK